MHVVRESVDILKTRFIVSESVTHQTNIFLTNMDFDFGSLTCYFHPSCFILLLCPLFVHILCHTVDNKSAPVY